MHIPFNRSPGLPSSLEYMAQATAGGHLSGDGPFTKKCSEWIERQTGVFKALLTTSCSHALDISSRLCNILPGDEVILPSYTFSSTANAFAGMGAQLVFVDIRPDTMNLDERLVEAAVTPKTKAIVPVHYAGIACEMDEITDIARQHNLYIVEDAAQGVMASYKGRALGAMSHFGTFSFHETKNFSMGEGGALLLGDAATAEAAEIIREKGTDRSKFFRGQVDKYSWVEWGSSYLPSELNAAFLWGQLEAAQEITDARMAIWQRYNAAFAALAAKGRVVLPTIPAHCTHNAHMFYIKAANLDERTRLLAHLKVRNILAVYHYVPLHSAPAGHKYGRFSGQDVYTTAESERLLRLPLYYGLSTQDVDRVIEAVHDFYAVN